MPAPYSAGSIFVSVMPSFKDNQRDIAREYQRRGEEASKSFSDGFDKQIARDLPKAMERSAKSSRTAQVAAGKEAGDGYSSSFRRALAEGLKAAEKDLERLRGSDGEIKVPVDVDKDKFRNSFNALVRDIALTRADVKVGADVGQALFDVERLAARMKALRDSSSDVDLRSGLTGALSATSLASRRAREAAAITPEPTQQPQRQLGGYDQALAGRLKSTLNVLPPVQIDADTTPAERKIIEFRVDAQNLLDDLEADVQLDGDDTLARARGLMTLLEGVIETADPTAEIDASFNSAGALAQLKAWEKAVDPIEIPVTPEMGFFRSRLATQLRAAGEALPEVEVGVDATDAQVEMARIRAELMSLAGDVKVGFDLDEAQRKSREFQLQLGALRRETVDIEVEVDASRAIIELKAVEKAARDADSEMDRSGRNAGDAANSFRAFSGRVLGVAALGPLAIPVVGALAGAIGALGPLAVAGAAGLGVFALGVMGVSDAVQAMGDVQKNASKDAKAYADGVRNAGRSLRDAETGLADARRSAADSAVSSRERVEQAIEREQDAIRDVARANRDYDDAVKDATTAQEGLTQAKSDYADRLIDLQYQIRGGALAERRAYMQLAEAEVAYANALSDPGATRTEREQLLLDLDEQKYRLDGVLASNKDLADQQQETNSSGVEGSAQVVAANKRVEDANRGVQDAQERVADAEKAAADARKDIAKAQSDQQRAAADSARAIESAQLRLADAQIDYADAIAKTSASQDTLAESLAKLSPAGRDFATYIFSLKGYVNELRDAAQGGLLPGLTEYLDGIITARGPQFVSIVGGMSTALGDMFRQFGESLQGDQFGAFFDMVESKGPVFLGQIGDALTNLGEGTASLLTAFAPSAENFGDDIVAATERFDNWAAGLSTNPEFQEFLEWWERVGPKVVDFIQAFAGAITNIGVALAPYAEDLMEMLTGILDWIAEADPQTVANIALGFIGLAVAFQTLVGLNALITGATTIWGLGAAALALFNGTAVTTGAVLAGIAGSVAIALAAIGLLAIGFYLLWTNSETFRNIVTGAWDAIVAAVMVAVQWFETYVWPIMQAIFQQIGDIASWLYENMIKPAFDSISRIFAEVMSVLEHVWNKVGKPVFDVFMSIVQAVWSVLSPIFQLIGIAFSALGSLIAWYWENVVGPVFRFFAEVAADLWENVLGPIFRFIADGFGVLVGYLASAWETVGAPVFALFAAILEGLVAVFTGTKADIESIWEALLDILMAPIVFVVETVLNNGLIAGINWIAQLFTDDDQWIDPIPTDWIPGRAMGGEIPGSSPNKRADNVLIRATAGEYMQQVDAVDYYGLDVMEAMNQRLIPRDFFAGLAGRAYGGPIDRALGEAVTRRFPSARVTSAYRPGDTGYHGRRQAVDFAGASPYPNLAGVSQMLEINQWLASTMGSGLAQLIHTAPGAVNLLGGKPHTYALGTQEEHRNHVHAAIESISALGSAGLAGAVASGSAEATSIFGQLSSFISNPGDFLRNLVTDFAGDALNSKVGQALIEVPLGLASGIKDALLDLVGLGGPAYQTSGQAFSNDGEGPVRDIVKQAAGLRGWGEGGEWDAIAWIINRESGWNPNAQNPTSTASGLFQHINSTWNSYKPVGVTATRMRDANPSQQATAGMNYIAARYGTPNRARQFWNANGYYADGGLIEALASPTLHDQGGVIDPGWNLIHNATGQPEASLNPTQLENIRRIADDGGQSGPFRDLVLPMVASNPHEAADTIVHEVKVATGRGGRYRGEGG